MTTPNLGPSPQWTMQQGLSPELKQWEQEATAMREVMMAALSLAKVNITSCEQWGISDDGLDYLNSAMENAHNLTIWYSDHNWTAFQAWLNEPADNWGACDGEVRNDLAKDKEKYPQLHEANRIYEES